MNNILVIRMLELGDVASVAIPAIRHIRTTHPNANITCLTHGQGQEILNLAEPSISLLTLENGDWPENIFQALEAFLGLAERIIGSKFDSIINLDTAFMPCFLARFLKDTGEPVVGNVLSISLQELLNQLQNQTLDSEYVNQCQNYMQSSFKNMYKWHSKWWENDNLYENGYPEYYLKKCCGWSEMNFDARLLTARKALCLNNKQIYLALDDERQGYSQMSNLTKLLRENGFTVEVDNQSASLESRLQIISNSSLVVSLANAVHAFAAGTGTATLLIPLMLDPRVLMPDFAADQSIEIPNADSLSESILSIFESA